MQSVLIRCEYIWLSAERQGHLHSKTRVINFKTEDPANWNIKLEDIPAWSFNGSKTGHAPVSDSTCLLRPVFAAIDPNRKNAILVLCDVLNTDFTPHAENFRAHLIDTILENSDKVPLVGFGQEFRLIKIGQQESQERLYYQAQVGDRPRHQREIVESHLNSCIQSGIVIDSLLSEDQEDKWQYLIGGPDTNPVQACDHLCISRFLLERMAENFEYSVNYHWEDSLNITVSTSEMRESKDSNLIFSIAEKICSPTYKFVVSSIYGTMKDHLEPDTYSCTSTEADVLLPWTVPTLGSGYLEDTRPFSGSDPYLLSKVILDAVCKA